MKKYACSMAVLALFGLANSPVYAEDKPCFESRQGYYSEVLPTKNKDGLPNVKCSPRTGGVLWWSDPFDGTIDMGAIPIPGDYSVGKAVVKPREEKILFMPLCTTACHNGITPPPPLNKSRTPRVLTLHQEIVPDALNLQHGKGAIWCLDCHNVNQRNKLIDNFGNPISFNEPQKLCGKCHGPIYRDWRDGIHGKRIGEWASTGQKRWFVCTECHNPHDVQQGVRGSGFVQLAPEPAPVLPKGVKNANHERHSLSAGGAPLAPAASGAGH